VASAPCGPRQGPPANLTPDMKSMDRDIQQPADAYAPRSSRSRGRFGRLGRSFTHHSLGRTGARAGTTPGTTRIFWMLWRGP
jgi:hypothetical protein